MARQLSLDSAVWEHGFSSPKTLTIEKSLLPSKDDGDNDGSDHDNDNDNDDERNDENPYSSMNDQNILHNSQLPNNDLPDDLDDRIDDNAEEHEDDAYPIRYTEAKSDLLRDSFSKPSEMKERNEVSY